MRNWETMLLMVGRSAGGVDVTVKEAIELSFPIPAEDKEGHRYEMTLTMTFVGDNLKTIKAKQK